ncbi:MAG: hypothetical protein WD512_01545 [Candidatus Paceibacterota bacterium]
MNPQDQMNDESSSSSSELIRGYRMENLRSETIQERKDKLLKNVTRHCNDAIRYSGDMTSNYPKSRIDEDLQEWLPKELSERGVDSFYTVDGYFLKMFLDDALLQPEEAYESDQEEEAYESDQEEEAYESDQEEDKDTSEDKPSYNTQLVLLLMIMAIATIYYIKVCYLNNITTSTGCKEVVEQYFNRTAQQFISHSRTEENTDMFG